MAYFYLNTTLAIRRSSIRFHFLRVIQVFDYIFLFFVSRKELFNTNYFLFLEVILVGQ